MYTINKIAVNSWNPDGSCIYERTLSDSNWRDLMYRVHHLQSSDWPRGAGVNVERDGVFICHSSDLDEIANYQDKKYYQITLTDVA